MTVTIGVDPHKRSHTAVAVDGEENEVARTRVIAGPNQLAELNGFAAGIGDECRWAIEAATGVGLLLAQQFTRAGNEDGNEQAGALVSIGCGQGNPPCRLN